MDKEERIHRVQVLIEEWKILAGYVESAFSTLEKHSIYIVLLIGAAAGIGSKFGKVPEQVWLFAGPAVLTLLFRMTSQLSFSYFQAHRILSIEDKLRHLLRTKNDDGDYFQYGHELQRLAARLRATKAYSYPYWLGLTSILGLAMVIYSTCQSFRHLWSPTYQGRILACVYVIAVVFAVAVWVYCGCRLNEEFKKTFGEPTEKQGHEQDVS